MSTSDLSIDDLTSKHQEYARVAMLLAEEVVSLLAHIGSRFRVEEANLETESWKSIGDRLSHDLDAFNSELEIRKSGLIAAFLQSQEAYVDLLKAIFQNDRSNDAPYSAMSGTRPHMVVLHDNLSSFLQTLNSCERYDFGIGFHEARVATTSSIRSLQSAVKELISKLDNAMLKVRPSGSDV